MNNFRCSSVSKLLNKLSFGFSLFILFQANAALAQSGGIGEFLKNVLKQASGYNSYEDARFLYDYNDIVRLHAYGHEDIAKRVRSGNAGLSDYLQSIYDRDDKLKEQAFQFYFDVSLIDILKVQASGFNLREKASEPRISEIVGRGRASDLKPGWLWDLALKNASGDSQRAMRLIAVCGHDDKNQFTTLKLNPDRQKALIALNTWKLEKLISEIEQSKEWVNPWLVGELKRKLEILHLDYQGLNPCSGAFSVFYMPGSLGLGVDISPYLKKQIIGAQDSTISEAMRHDRKAEDVIVSKYFHVYGSAFVACEMISRGWAPSRVIEFETFMARIYRAERLNFSDEHISYLRKTNSTVPDALTLMNQVSLMSRLGFRYIPKNVELNLKKPEGWADERFSKASHRIATWALDFDWTEEQHRVGGSFAAQHCKSSR